MRKDQRDAGLENIDRQITWALEHPGLPAWVKDALRSALEQHPPDAANDAELLRFLLAALSARWTARALSRNRDPV